ncbi:large conductance mechanosensitive channel protein MscL [Synechococcus sp. UW179A]|uniref:large conductance mechanosensitive channel protein MscL n=1 Tax=Synechococcus sp. UW179A TaxID=2575510 RepID=UPI000E0EEDB7|nr:large conductance mechanosensitive channel protein MscL [Synechococcus sp. UW179A]
MPKKITFFSDFKAFINKGNVIDLAVAVIIAGAFGKVVNSTVELIMTNALEPALKEANVQSLAQLPGGEIIVAAINFIIIAFVCFLVVRTVERMKRKKEVIETSKPDPQVQLTSAITRLTEVMESLNNKS